MTRSTLLGRWSAAAAAVTLLAGLTATTAAARPDPGEPPTIRFPSYDLNCPLARIDSQLVRCDNLTGGGVAASLRVPEL